MRAPPPPLTLGTLLTHRFVNGFVRRDASSTSSTSCTSCTARG